MKQTRSQTPLILGIVLVFVAVAAIAAVVLSGGGGDDDDGDAGPAVVAPALRGTDYAGEPVEVVPGEDGPLMLVFLAHWCPHCNREIPVLQEWEASGDIPDDLQVVGISTAVDEAKPNYPPDQWLEQVGWTWPVLADDEEQTFAQTYGVRGYPWLVFVAGDGSITTAASGELSIATLQQLADEAVSA